MPLTWDIKDCKESPEVLWSDERKALTEYFIFATMTIGIGHWTEANINEVYARIKFIECLYGPSIYDVNPDGGRTMYSIKPEDVRALIGLGTNVAPESRASFIKRHLTDPRTGQMADWEREMAKASAEAA